MRNARETVAARSAKPPPAVRDALRVHGFKLGSVWLWSQCAFPGAHFRGAGSTAAGPVLHPNIERDILAMRRVDKPSLLKRLFELGAGYSGQILSCNKMLGQLQDAGNTTTLARYLDLLANAGLIAGLPKYARGEHLRKGSSPKLNVLDTALMSALSGYTFEEARADRSFWGRLVESAVGAHLFNTGAPETRLHYWRNNGREVDFVLGARPEAGRRGGQERRAPGELERARGVRRALRRHGLPPRRRGRGPTIGVPVHPSSGVVRRLMSHFVVGGSQDEGRIGKRPCDRAAGDRALAPPGRLDEEGIRARPGGADEWALAMEQEQEAVP